MTQAMRHALTALVVCAALVAPALAGRQLKQSSGTINFPGCTFLGDSEIAMNRDFSSLYTYLQASGLSDALSNLSAPATLFAPTNTAFADLLLAANLTMDEALSSRYLQPVLLSHVVPQAIMSESDFMDGEVLPTLLENSNVTIMVDEVNNTEVVTVVSYAAEATIVTPAAYACNLVIYGIDGALVPEDLTYPMDMEALVTYLTQTLRPGSAEVPLSLLVEAVEGGQTQAVVEAALSAVNNGYLQQLTALYEEATGNQEALVALAAVGNEAIQMSSCATYTPFLQQLPSAEDLQEAESTQRIVAESYPAYAQCASEAS